MTEAQKIAALLEAIEFAVWKHPELEKAEVVKAAIAAAKAA